MGVPSFFAWLVKKYEAEILYERDPFSPAHPVDILYLDLNCAIHPAVKAIPMTQDKMYPAVWDYLCTIVAACPPRRCLYIAIDGVAPFAKMRQQRCRRYKAVADREATDRLKRQYHQPVTPSEDFNMISPGTAFMAALSRHLRQQIATAQAQGAGPRDPAVPDWSQIEVIFSDADEVGEGEHKIMRHMRTVAPPTWRAAIYGLDSDLIFLCLANYRPRLALVREAQLLRDNGPHNDTSVNTKIYHYLSVEHLRNRLLYVLNPALPLDELFRLGFNDRYFPPTAQVLYEQARQHPDFRRFYRPADDEQRLINDYVLFCFFLGNDFLPALPSLKIKEGGLDQLMIAYKYTLTMRREFLWSLTPSSSGSPHTDAQLTINRSFLQGLFTYLTVIEDHFLQDQTRARSFRVSRVAHGEAPTTYETALALHENIEVNVPDNLQLGFPGWPERYYQQCFGYRYYALRPQGVHHISKEYLRGVCWVLRYYFQPQVITSNLHGEWWWSYPYDYGPAVSDMGRALSEQYVDLGNLPPCPAAIEEVPADLPFLPAFQLLCILPPQSAPLLPPLLGPLLTEAESPLAAYYPLTVGLHTALKRYRWECHPQLPPLPLRLLWAVLRPLLPLLPSRCVQSD